MTSQFTYQPRVSETLQVLADAISTGDTAQLQDMIRQLEQRDRELEDYLAHLHSGGTSKSILAVYGTADIVSGSATLTGSSVMAVDIPADPAFDYYLDWRINGTAYSYTSGFGFQMSVFAGFDEFSNGAGFEGYGYSITIPDGVVSGCSPGGILYMPGSGGRIQAINTGVLGTTVHLRTSWQVYDASATFGAQIHTNALLIAIPH